MKRLFSGLIALLLAASAYAATFPGPIPIAQFGLKQARVAALADCTTSNAAATFTSTSLGFTQADRGKKVVCTQSTTLISCSGTIKSVSGNVATVNPCTCAGPTSISSSTVCNTGSITTGIGVVGFDNTVAIQAALDYTRDNGGGPGIPGGVAVMPIGVYLAQPTITVPAGVTLRGSGRPVLPDSTALGGRLTTGSVIMNSLASTSAFIKLGSTIADLLSIVEDIGIDGSDQTTAVVQFAGSLATMRRTMVAGAGGGAEAIGLYMTAGVGPIVYDSDIANHNTGTPIYVQTSDAIIGPNNYIRGGANNSGTHGQIHVFNSVDVLIQGNHLWQGGAGVISASFPGNSVLLESTTSGKGAYSIIGNHFDGTYGHQIALKTTGTGTLNSILIASNSFWEVSPYPNNTYDIINIATAATPSVIGLTVVGNTADTRVAAVNFRSLVNNTGAAGDVVGLTITGNTAQRTLNIMPTGQAVQADGGIANNWRRTDAGVVAVTSNRGTGSFAGNGAITVFTIAHGLDDTPTYAHISLSTVVTGNFTVTKDATNITVTFATAPAGATTYIWSAGL